jgi:hypothetical protein
MRTFESFASVTPDGTLMMNVPFKVSPGKHKVVVVIDEMSIDVPKSGSFLFPVDSYGSWPDGLSLNREDMYSENGR